MSNQDNHQFKKKELSEMSKEELTSYRDSLIESAKDPNITEGTQNFLMKEVIAVDEELGLRDNSKTSLLG